MNAHNKTVSSYSTAGLANGAIDDLTSKGVESKMVFCPKDSRGNKNPYPFKVTAG